MDTQISDVASQKSSPEVNHPRNPLIATEQFPESQTGIEPVPLLSVSKSCPTDIREPDKRITTTPNDDTNKTFSY